MKRLLSLILLVAALVPASTTAAATLPTTVYGGGAVVQQIHIKGIVPYMRVIYVDSSQRIVSVVGNTDDNNVKLTVARDDSKTETKMTPYIYDQYQQILADNNNEMKAGVTYYPKQSSVNLAASLQLQKAGPGNILAMSPKIDSLKLAAY